MEIKINKEIREYSESMFLGLSLRQCVFSLLAMLTAIGLFFAVRDVVSEMQIAWICTLGAAPLAALGFVKYQGMAAEQFLLAFIRTELLLPERLVFEGENTYANILLPALEEGRKHRHKLNKKYRRKANEII